MEKTKRCGKCGKTGKLKRTIFANGGEHVAYQCDCGHHSKWLKKEELEKAGINIYTLEIHKMYNDVVVCEVRGCTNWGYEWHHIAPRHLFGDESGLWPQIKLCKYHHRQWHDIVTPLMAQVKK